MPRPRPPTPGGTGSPTSWAPGLQQLRDLSHGLHPGLLDAEGLGPALQAHLRRGGTRGALVVGEAARGRRFDPAVEAAVYGCAADAARTLGPLQRCALDLDGSGCLRLTLAGPAVDRARTASPPGCATASRDGAAS
jgi:hypothetical protein